MATLSAVLSIALIDLVLSGDNAAVIGLAIRNLPHRQRRLAATLGAGGAILFRVTLTALATLLVRVPYLSALGGLVLVWITWKLVAGEDDEHDVQSSAHFWGAMATIVIADVSMSFDNVLGVAGAAGGSITLLAFGLLLSIPIVVAGSNILGSLMNRYPIVVYAGGAVLAHTSLAMIFADHGLGLPRHTGTLAPVMVAWGAALAVLIYGGVRVRQARPDRAALEVASDLEVLGDTLKEGLVEGLEEAATREKD